MKMGAPPPPTPGVYRMQGPRKGGQEERRSLLTPPFRTATCGGAPVALQQSRILRAGT